jgi:hypothetical protein
MSDERLTLDEGTVSLARPPVVRFSEKTDKILPAMLAAQRLIRHAHKDSTNPHFQSSYASLNAVIDECKPHYNAVGIVLIQAVGELRGEVGVCTRLAEAVSGQWCECEMWGTPEKSGNQAKGSTISYFRRYTLQPLAFMGAEDDDGEAAEMRQPASGTKSRKQAPPDPPAADRAKSIREFGKEWDKTIAEVEDGDDADTRRNLEHYFLYVKAGDRAMTFDPRHDYMRPLKAEAIDTLTGILQTKRAEVVGWLETDDVREAVGLPKLSVETCAGCAAILTRAEKEKSAMVKLPKGYCETCRPDAMVAFMAEKKGA